MKRILTGIFGLFFLIGASGANAETQFIPISSAGAGEAVVSIKEMTHSYVSTRFVMPNNGSGSTHYASLCPVGEDGSERCMFKNTNKQGFGARSVLGVCDNAAEENCVSSVYLEMENGERVQGVLVREIDMGTFDFTDLARGLYASGKSGIWRFPGATHSGGSDNYFVNVATELHFDTGKNRFVVTSLKSLIAPFTEVRGDYERTGLYEVPCRPDDVCPTGFTLAGWGDFECIWQELGVCGKYVPFPPGFRYGVEFRASVDLVGWFRGRIAETEIKISEFSKTNNIFEISALPVAVPRFEAIVQKDKATIAQQKLVEKAVDTSAGWPVAGWTGERTFGGNIAKGTMAMSPLAIEWVNGLKNFASDTSYAETTMWNFESVYYSGNNRCLAGQDGVLGFVSSNATAMLGTPPVFEDGQLSYTVAGLHNSSKGELNLGTYDLVMSSSVARCLYGFSSAPINASIQVVNENGNAVVATTVVSEKDGWLKLAAYGFTFSEKEIRAKLTQPYSKTLTKFPGATKALSSKQKTEIKTAVAKATANPKFICTGVYVNTKDKVTALKRARAACDYAKSLDKNHSYWAQAKQSKAKSYDGKVMLISK